MCPPLLRTPQPVHAEQPAAAAVDPQALEFPATTSTGRQTLLGILPAISMSLTAMAILELQSLTRMDDSSNHGAREEQSRGNSTFHTRLQSTRRTMCTSAIARISAFRCSMAMGI